MANPRRSAQRLARKHMFSRGSGAAIARSELGCGTVYEGENNGSVAAVAVGLERGTRGILSTSSSVSQLCFEAAE